MNKDRERIAELVEGAFHGGQVRSVSRLGGMTNRTYYVLASIPDECGQKELTVRLPGEGTEEIIDRSDEMKSTQLACTLGIEPCLYWFDAQTGEKVSEFIADSQTMHPVDLQKEENILRVATTFDKLHSCGKNTGVEFVPVEMAKTYESVIFENGGTFFTNYAEVKAVVAHLNEAYFQKVRKVPCHNDALSENWILQSGKRMYLIDWEYAGMNDPMWDLADVAIEARLTQKQEAVLLKDYLRREPTRQDWWGMDVNKVMIDYLWSLWGKARAVFDGAEMETYAAERWARLQGSLKKIKEA